MEVSIRFDSSENQYKIFGGIENNLKEIAEYNKISMIELIKELIRDLANSDNKDYIKQIEQVDTEGMSPIAKAAFIDYLKDLLKRYNQIEKINRQKEKQKANKANKELKQQAIDEKLNKIKEEIERSVSEQEGISRLEAIRLEIEDIKNSVCNVELSKKDKKCILKKLEEMESEEAKEEVARIEQLKNQEEKQKKEMKIQREVKKMWEKINEIVKKETARGKSIEPKIWIAIRDKYFNQTSEEIQSYTQMKQSVLLTVKQMLEDEIYYQDVKYYTQDFTFLRDFPEVALGSSPRRGFSDMKSLFKYDDLRAELQEAYDEYRKINRLLQTETDDATIRILQARKIAIEKLREKRRREGRDI